MMENKIKFKNLGGTSRVSFRLIGELDEKSIKSGFSNGTRLEVKDPEEFTKTDFGTTLRKFSR